MLNFETRIQSTWAPGFRAKPHKVRRMGQAPAIDLTKPPAFVDRPLVELIQTGGSLLTTGYLALHYGNKGTYALAIPFGLASAVLVAKLLDDAKVRRPTMGEKSRLGVIAWDIGNVGLSGLAASAAAKKDDDAFMYIFMGTAGYNGIKLVLDLLQGL